MMKSMLTYAALALFGAQSCLTGSNLPEDPESIDSVKIGTKVNEWGRDFQFFEKDGTIFYGYIDLIDGRFVEGKLSKDWTSEVIQTLDLESDPSRGLWTFLVYENRGEKRDILVHLKEATFYWSHEEGQWNGFPELQGDPSSFWHATPIHSSLPWSGVLFVGLGQRGEGYTYFRINLTEDRIEKIAEGEEDNWKAIGRWNNQVVLANWSDHLSDRERTRTDWSFDSFSLGSGEIGQAVTSQLRSRYRTRRARVISTSNRNVVLLRNAGQLFVCGLVDEKWEGRNIRNEDLIREISDARKAYREVSGDISGLDVVEQFGKIFVMYSSGAGVMLQIWNSDFSEFSEYWMGDFAFSTQDAVRFIMSNPSKIVTLAKENLRPDEGEEFGVVDLVFRKWDLNELEKVRSGTFDDLNEVRSGTFETLEHAETMDVEVDPAADVRSMFETGMGEGLEAHLESPAFEADDFRDDNPYIQRRDIVNFVRDPYRLARGTDSEQARSATISRDSELMRFIVESFGDVEEWLDENDGFAEDGRVRGRKLVAYFEQVDLATGVVP